MGGSWGARGAPCGPPGALGGGHLGPKGCILGLKTLRRPPPVQTQKVREIIEPEHIWGCAAQGPQAKQEGAATRPSQALGATSGEPRAPSGSLRGGGLRGSPGSPWGSLEDPWEPYGPPRGSQRGPWGASGVPFLGCLGYAKSLKNMQVLLLFRNMGVPAGGLGGSFGGFGGPGRESCRPGGRWGGPRGPRGSPWGALGGLVGHHGPPGALGGGHLGPEGVSKSCLGGSRIPVRWLSRSACG